MKQPIGPTGLRVGRRVREVRLGHGMTLEQLGNKLWDLGFRMDASVLARLEKGQRRADVDELIAFALALDVSPLALLLDQEVPDGIPVDLTSTYSVPGAEAWTWALADGPYRRVPLLPETEGV